MSALCFLLELPTRAIVWMLDRICGRPWVCRVFLLGHDWQMQTRWVAMFEWEHYAICTRCLTHRR